MQMSLGFGEPGEMGGGGTGGKPHQCTNLVCGENDDKFPWAGVGRAALGHAAALLRGASFPGITSHHLLGYWESESRSHVCPGASLVTVVTEL